MVLLICPRCGGSGLEPSTGLGCGFCRGAKKVNVDDQELESCLKGSKSVAKGGASQGQSCPAGQASLGL